jgi:RTX calcium-binding nonapeptide repeat (4 copies)
MGTEGVDRMEGTDEEDYLAGLGGPDVFLASPGTDGIAGGEGLDVYILPGPETDYAIAPEAGGWRVTGPLGTAYLAGIEGLEFGDGTSRPLAEAVE